MITPDRQALHGWVRRLHGWVRLLHDQTHGWRHEGGRCCTGESTVEFLLSFLLIILLIDLRIPNGRR
jgi:hypothetical protein